MKIIQKCFVDLGFSDKIHWIIECIATTNFSVLVNGLPGDFFQPKRGMRQGGPIFLYIYVICAAYLGRYINFMANTPKFGVSFKVAKKDLLSFI